MLKATRKLILVIICLGLFSSTVSFSLSAEVKPGDRYNLKEYIKLTKRTISFREAPELENLVKQGKLPPVEKRLPENPLVIVPLEEVGKYGGTLKTLHLPAYLNIWPERSRETFLMYSTPYLNKILPNVAEAWKITNNGKTFTFFLRKGMKWSDGELFTADDIEFWYKDIVLNDELTPSKPSYLMSSGKIASFKKRGLYTVEFTFTDPNGIFLDILCTTGIFAPKHYLKQFHPNYNSKEEINKIMKKEGFDRWSDFFYNKANNNYNPECPTINAWISVNSSKEQVHILKRNPYYWKIDIAGNQLPYIDTWEDAIIQNEETYLLKTIAGEVDYTSIAFIGGLPNYPVIKQNENKGNYRLIPYIWPPNNIGTIFFNYDVKEANLKRLFNDKKFRTALSIAINREEISKLLFKGQAVPSQASPASGPPYFGEKSIFKIYTEYDPKRANQLLDEIGLTKRDEEGYRLGFNGDKLTIVLIVTSGWPFEDVEIAELCRKYWKEIGVRVIPKPVTQDQLFAMMREENYQMAMRALMLGGCTQNIFTRGELWPASRWWIVSPSWAKWIYSGGKEGSEPHSEVKKLKELFDKGIREPNKRKRDAIINEALKLNVENLWAIGVVNEPELAKQYIFKNRVRNINYSSDPIPAELFSIPPAIFFIKE